MEALVEGDEVAARHESEPGGAVEWKPVEATFRRTGRILHLHFANGELIRTTPEHPFFVEGKGWTAAGALKAGDRLETLIGDSVPVAEVYDTEQWDSVYNLRVADFHTYFVGDESWGFSVWAHNEYRTLFTSNEDKRGEPKPKYFNKFSPVIVEDATRPATPPAAIALQVEAAKDITLRIINALRESLPNDRAKQTTTGVAFVLVNGKVQLWVAENNAGTGPLAADRRRMLYQVFTKNAFVKEYLATNKIKVEVDVSQAPLKDCSRVAKRVFNPKNANNLTALEQSELAAWRAAHPDEPEGKGLNVLNHAERHIYRQLAQVSGATLLAIGSTIRMCPDCEAETVRLNLQYAITVPTVSGHYVTSPEGWVEKRPTTP